MFLYGLMCHTSMSIMQKVQMNLKAGLDISSPKGTLLLLNN